MRRARCGPPRSLEDARQSLNLGFRSTLGRRSAQFGVGANCRESRVASRRNVTRRLIDVWARFLHLSSMVEGCGHVGEGCRRIAPVFQQYHRVRTPEGDLSHDAGRHRLVASIDDDGSHVYRQRLSQGSRPWRQYPGATAEHDVALGLAADLVDTDAERAARPPERLAPHRFAAADARWSSFRPPYSTVACGESSPRARASATSSRRNSSPMQKTRAAKSTCRGALHALAPSRLARRTASGDRVSLLERYDYPE